MTDNNTEARQQLHAAWEQMLTGLQAARDVIDDPACFPPPPSDRNLAEGYRYLAGFMHHAIERSFFEDPDYPAFRNALSVYNKSTIDNADAIYFYAAIDGRKRYRVHAALPDHRHWRGEPRAARGPLAPQYLIFETQNGQLAGDTGDLRELMPGSRTGFGTLDTSQLLVGENGELEILLGPELPAGYQGNFICTRKPPASKDPGGGDRYATYISGRQLFYDWEREEAVPLTITCLDTEGEHPPALDPARAAASLTKLGDVVQGQMRFWLAFYDRVLNCNGTHEGDGRYFMPVNSYNSPNAASGDTGGGMSTNIYAGGIFDLAEDEALYIEARYHGEPVYTGMHLGNLWGESPDYANHQSSLNGFQMHMGEGGVQRWVVAHRDPGVPNWVDTTGLPRGYLSHRWAYSTLPPEDQWPTISARVVKLSGVRDCFPTDTPEVSPAQRRAAIALRQRHVQRRFRVF
ncbi:hypothetical protein FV139_10960 [Parahaliea maris]|uniref:DUF1214 domain-containing protein n=1 Tax=Parahaliea maris TaxID=2716870 RepID=A0A5C9A3C1_9GAMM|nr:hypothetical protein [Parahaliea maris]TXS94117.1 hypothetical protein FV139_10960 [Parahaliea maris]